MTPSLVGLLAAISIGCPCADQASSGPSAVKIATVDPVVKGAWHSEKTEPTAPHPGRFGPLTPDERELAATAWRYFRNNTQPATGLVNSVDQYPSTTLWDVGSSLGGIAAAQGLGLIGVPEATARIGAILDTMDRIDLFHGLCPNKAYNTITGVRVDYNNKPGEIGCSAIDVGRLLVWMDIVAQRYPSLEPRVRAAVGHWRIGSLVSSGRLQGATNGVGGRTFMVEEGRLLYKEYAAKAFRVWGLDAGEAEKPEPYRLVSLYGVVIPYDARDSRLLGAHNYVVSETAILDGLEFGWNEPNNASADPFEHCLGWSASVANAIYLAQEARYARTGLLTARTEHQLSGPPYFVYDTLFTDGTPWMTLTDAGKSFPKAAAVSAKAAVGLWALWRTSYTDLLFAMVLSLENPDRGVREGRLEAGGEAIEVFTANTNGVILESLLYKVQGQLRKPRPLESLIKQQPSKSAGCLGL